jgi:hypothetical protein
MDDAVREVVVRRVARPVIDAKSLRRSGEVAFASLYSSCDDRFGCMVSLASSAAWRAILAVPSPAGLWHVDPTRSAPSYAGAGLVDFLAAALTVAPVLSRSSESLNDRAASASARRRIRPPAELLAVAAQVADGDRRRIPTRRAPPGAGVRGVVPRSRSPASAGNPVAAVSLAPHRRANVIRDRAPAWLSGGNRAVPDVWSRGDLCRVLPTERGPGWAGCAEEVRQISRPRTVAERSVRHGDRRTRAGAG